MDKLSTLKALAHQELMDVLDELKTTVLYHCLTDPGLVRGTGSAAKVKAGTGTYYYLHNGIFKSVAGAEVEFTADDHDIPAHATLVQEALYLVCLNAGGTLTLHMGEITGVDEALLPDIPEGLTPIGYAKIKVSAGATDFDASSDLLSAGHLDDSYVNLGFLSPRFDATQ